jgi:hypothetical protein
MSGNDAELASYRDAPSDPTIGLISSDALPGMRAFLADADRLPRDMAFGLIFPVWLLSFYADAASALRRDREFCERFPELRTAATLFPGVSPAELQRRARKSSLVRKALRYFEARGSVRRMMVVPAVYWAVMIGIVVHAFGLGRPCSNGARDRSDACDRTIAKSGPRYI